MLACTLRMLVGRLVGSVYYVLYMLYYICDIVAACLTISPCPCIHKWGVRPESAYALLCVCLCCTRCVRSYNITLFCLVLCLVCIRAVRLLRTCSRARATAKDVLYRTIIIPLVHTCNAMLHVFDVLTKNTAVEYTSSD